MTETATQAKSSTSPIDVARSFFAAYNAHDVEGGVPASFRRHRNLRSSYKKL